MKNRRSIYIVSSVFGVGFILLALVFSSAQIVDLYKPEQQNNLVLKVIVPKQNYVKGEIVSLEIGVTNTSSSGISSKGVNVESGYLKIFISSFNQEFRQYIPGGVRQKTKGLIISGGETVKSQTKILWNFVPETKNLNDGAIKEYKDNQLMTNYAFPKAGTYFVKAVLIIPGQSMTKIESEPIQIIIDDPVENDLEVWNQIKDSGEIAYFTQYDEFRSLKNEKQEKLLEEIERITIKYPNSFLVSQIRQSLVRFRLNEAEKNEFMRKLKQP